MKKIFMIGDSIRFGASGNPGRPGSPAVTDSPGYGICVKEKLKGIPSPIAIVKKSACCVCSRRLLLQ